MKKKKISNKILQTELSFAIKLIEQMNFGDAKFVICKVLERVEEYEL